MSFKKLLNKTCEIQRYSASQSSTGQLDKTWATVSTPKCRVQKRLVSQNKDLASPYADASHVIYMLPDVNVLDEDRIVVGANVFEIVAVQKDSSEHHFEIFAKLIIQK